MRYARSLRDIMGPKEAKKWMEKAVQEASGGRKAALLSPHPVDRVIREVIQSSGPISASQIDQIVARMAQVEFPTVKQHLAKRIRDKQWVETTAEEEYLRDLRSAILNSGARLVVYQRRGGNMAAVLANTQEIVAKTRRGSRWQPLLFVAYSADRGIIVSGYQASALEEISIPKGAQWLK